MDLHSNEGNRYGLKDPVVKLERCDKIWKTLQLIRSLQDKHLEDLEDWIKREPIESVETIRKQPPMTFIPDKSLPLNLIGEPNLPKPYIKYHPIFNNGNESLPQFKLAEKSRVNLYHCGICSQEFCDYRRFTDHQEAVHRIIMSKKSSAKKEKLQNKSSGDLRSRQNSMESNNHSQINKTLVSDENIERQTVDKNPSPKTDIIRCKLCGEYFLNIKKHMVDYHKIKYIGVLSKVTDKNLNFAKDQSVVEYESLNYTAPERVKETANRTKQVIPQDVDFSIKNITNVSKRKLRMPSIGPRKRLRSVSSREKESGTENQSARLKCEICGKEYADYKTLHNHRVRHKSRNKDKESSEGRKNLNQSVDPASRHKTNTEISAKSVQDTDSDNNNIDPKITRTRSSFTKECSNSDALGNGNLTSMEKKDTQNLEIKCMCGRTFRTTSILSNHKFGCKFVIDAEACKSSDTRTGNDKDSGISITIKKKNNSYEIVTKEGSDEEPLRNGHNIKESGICEESSDSSSDNSDSSEFDDQPENLIPEKSKYSENHRILKLKVIDQDVNVNIEEDMCEDNYNASAVDDDNNILSKNECHVPSLSILCKKILIQQGIMPKGETSHKCRTCKIFLGSKERLSKHIEKHKKLLKKSCSCGIKFAGVRAFDDHVAAVHPKCIVCPYCNEKHISIVALAEHLCIVAQGAPYTETFNENHPCPNCNIAFDNITWLDSHMRSKHLDPNLPFPCYQCSEKFPNDIARSSHSHEKHNNVAACSVCNQKFQGIKSKHRHEAYHRGVGFPCHICKKTYRSKRNQMNHVRTVHSDFSNNKLECFICQKSIKTKSFQKHVLRHNSILKCEMCDTVVYSLRNLERHIIEYHGNENYPRKKCNICGVSFPTREQLEAHIMVEKSEGRRSDERYKNM